MKIFRKLSARILGVFTLTIIATSVRAADGDTFRVKTVEGVEMEFMVISEADKICQVGDGSNTSVDQLTRGVITIPNSVNGYVVTNIGSRAFVGCNYLMSVTIPNSVTSIGSSAFVGCFALTSVTIPNSVTNIGDGAFSDCLGLTSVTIPNSITNIGSAAFANCSGLTSVTIPSSVTNIGDGAFHGCSGLTSVTIPNSVTTIGEYAFSGCSGLTSVTIPSSVTNIGYSAFSYSGLTSVTIPNSVTNIDDYTFFSCTSLTSVTIPNSVTNIGYSVFSGCSGLTSVTIPNSVTNIGYSVFSGCSGLTSVVVQEGNSVYDSRDNCNAIIETSTNKLLLGCKNTVIPNSVTSIGSYAFYGCSGLASITISSNVIAIGEEAFRGCNSVNTIIVDEGNAAYDSRNNCNAIIDTWTNTLILGCKNTTIPQNITSIGAGAFENCIGLTSIILPRSITQIGSRAFEGCINLEQITIPNSVIYIGDYAFDRCDSLKNFTIPHRVTKLGKGILAFSSNIKKVTSKIRNPFAVSDAFYGLLNSETKDITLYVPYGTKSKYESIDGWKQFPNIVETEKELDINETFTAKSIEGVDITFQVLNQDYQCRVGDGNNTAVISSSPQHLTIPEAVNDYTVISVAENAFSRLSSLIDISFPETVLALSDQMFKDCNSLAAIQWNAEVPLSSTAMDGITNPNLLLYVKDKNYAPSGIWNVVVNGIADNIVLHETAAGNNFYCPKEFTANSIEYTHNYSMTSGYHTCAGWETIALPFDVENITYENYVGMVPIQQWMVGSSLRPFWLYEQTPDGWKAATAIKGNIPYIICMPNNKDNYQDTYNISGEVTFRATDVQVFASESAVAVKYGERQFVPNYQCQAADSKIYAMNVNNQWEQNTNTDNLPGSVFVSGLRGIHPFEAYMTSGSMSAPQYIPVFVDDLSTEISIPIKQQVPISDDSIYDLAGRKIGRSSDIKIQKGIYIVNGKKWIIK